MYVSLPSVTINIAGQNNKKGAKVKYQKRASSRSCNLSG